jgi:hypothetical protein
MTYSTRLFFNNENWAYPTNADVHAFANNGYGSLVNFGNNLVYRFGFEEWLNNKILLSYRIGFLESYRNNIYQETVDKILLYTKIGNNIFHVANLFGVSQIANNLIPQIRNELIMNNWSTTIENDFNGLGDNRLFHEYLEYQQHWLSNSVVKNNNECGYCINISYQKIEFNQSSNFVNLSALDNQNSFYHNWQYLSTRFNLRNFTNNLNANNPLFHYLNNQIIL